MKLLVGIWYFILKCLVSKTSEGSELKLSAVGMLRRKELRETLLARRKLVAQLYELSEERDRQDKIFMKHGLNPRTAHLEAHFEVEDHEESPLRVPDALWDVPRDDRWWIKKEAT